MSQDLIKRSDAIEAVARLCAWHGSEGAWVLQEDVIEALENVTPNESKQEWIPCSEGLPQNEEEVLTTIIGLYPWAPKKKKVVVAALYETDSKYVWGIPQTDPEVIAWRPLPDPYEEGGEQ